jgi:hypothetical protein
MLAFKPQDKRSLSAMYMRIGIFVFLIKLCKINPEKDELV